MTIIVEIATEIIFEFFECILDLFFKNRREKNKANNISRSSRILRSLIISAAALLFAIGMVILIMAVLS